MKPQHLQANDAKKDFREACTALSNPSAFSTGKEYRQALDKRTAAMAKLYNEGIINDALYQELMFHDDFSHIPDALK